MTQGSLLGPRICGNEKNGWFFNHQSFIFLQPKWQFLFKITKGWVFFAKWAIFLQVWWKLRNLTCCSKYSRSNKHPVFVIFVFGRYFPLVLDSFIKQKTIKQLGSWLFTVSLFTMNLRSQLIVNSWGWVYRITFRSVIFLIIMPLAK